MKPTTSSKSKNQEMKSETSRYLSSDETQSIEADISTAIEADISTESGFHLPEVLAANLPPASRENIERLLGCGQTALTQTRTYIRENPAEAAGLVVASGAVIWALLGTRPGRRIMEVGAPLIRQYVSDGISQTFALQGLSHGQNMHSL